MRTGMVQAVLLPIFIVEIGFGCSLRSMELQRVSPDLTIVVTHREKPISGITVDVSPEGSGEPVFTSTTNGSGIVRIRGLLPGHYYLTAHHVGFEAGKEWIEVTDAAGVKRKRRFDFQWADGSYQTRTVAGVLTGLLPGNTGNKLMDIVHPQKTFYPGVEITLKNAFSTDQYRTVTDSTGAFFIADVPDGVYIMAIPGGMKSLTGIADATQQVVDVERTASRTSLPLQLRDTGCYRTEFQITDE